MEVTLLANYAYDEQESMRRYADLLRELLEQEGWKVHLLRPEPWFGRLKPSGQGLGKWLGYLDKFILFPLVLRRHLRTRQSVAGSGKFLVHICDHSNAIYTRWLGGVPHLVTCHDVFAIQSARGLIPQYRTKWSGRILQSWIFSGLRRVRKIICVSDETQKELLSLAPELKERSSVIENTLSYPYAPMPVDLAAGHLEALGCGDSPYLLHVGGDQWYKNREGVIRIFGRFHAVQPNSPLKLIMAGKPATTALRQVMQQENVTDRVIFTGTVSNEQLRALYTQAEALLFPSLKEGFGWPILEANACGCPVLTSNRSPMNRLAGLSALLAYPEEPETFVKNIIQLSADNISLRLQRKNEARGNADRYLRKNFRKEMVNIYKSIF